MHAYKQPVSVLVVIYTAPSAGHFDTLMTGSRQDRGVRVLLLERADHPGYWQSVTGSVEGDETPVQTAFREVWEETGIDAALHRLTDWHQQTLYEIYPQWRHRYAPGITHNTEHVFGLKLTGEMPVKLAPREHLHHQWLSWPDAADKVFSPSNRAAILRLPALESEIRAEGGQRSCNG